MARTVEFSIFLILLILNIFCGTDAAGSNVKANLAKLQSDVKTLQGDKAGLEKSLASLSEKLDQQTGENEREEKIQSLVEGSLEAVEKFKSNEPTEVISGILELTSLGLATFGGPVGAAAAVVLDILTGLISLFASDPKTEPTMADVMREVLNEFRDEELLLKMNSLISTLQSVHAGITSVRETSKATEGMDLSDADVTRFDQKIKTVDTMLILREARENIATEIVSTKASDNKRAIKSFEAYCKLSVMLEFVIFEFISLIKTEAKSATQLPTFYNGVLENKRQDDKEYFKFLAFPKSEQAVTAAIYQAEREKHPSLNAYIKALKIVFPESDLKEGQEIYLNPKEWSSWYLYMTSTEFGEIIGSQNTNDQNIFVLRKSEPHAKNRWRLENKYYNTYDVTSTKPCGSLNQYPEELDVTTAGVLKSSLGQIKQHCTELCKDYEPEKNCKLCQDNCYNFYASKESFHPIILFYDDPRSNWISRSVNYIWTFTKIDMPKEKCDYYLVSATQSQLIGYTLLMGDNNVGGAQLKYGHPSEKGIFKLKKESC